MARLKFKLVDGFADIADCGGGAFVVRFKGIHDEIRYIAVGNDGKKSSFGEVFFCFYADDYGVIRNYGPSVAATAQDCGVRRKALRTAKADGALVVGWATR